MDITALIALSMGAAWASGLNLYATCAMLGIMGATGSMDLPAGLETLENPWVIAAAGAMYVVEFFADKIPGVDSAWDTIHSFIRVPAGAVLAATVFADASTAEMLAAGAGGGVLTAATHTIKAGSRLLINTSPEPFSNWTASVSEDVAVFGGLWLALSHPAVFIGVLVVFILLAIWLLPKLWRAIRMLFSKIAKLFGKKTEEPPLEGVRVTLGRKSIGN
ncbi:MAG: hypothetical protein ACI9JL_003543 [Paracoccaceae bacterium]|jgi:hypothetical protein